MNRDRSRGAGGGWTRSHRGRSSHPHFHSTNRSPHGACVWQPRGSPSGHNTESFSCEREVSADGISNRFASMSPLDNPYRHDDSPQSTSSHVGTPKLVKPDSSIEQPSSFSASGSDQKDSPSSCQPGKECSPVTSCIMTNESTRGRSSRPPDQSTNRSASGANDWRHGGFPWEHNTEPFSYERQGRETFSDGISQRLDNPYRHGDSLQSTPSHVATPKQVKLNSSIEQPYCSSASGPKQKDSPSSFHSVKDCSPVTGSIMINESTSDHAVDSGFGKKHYKEIKPSEQSSQEQASNVDKSENPVHPRRAVVLDSRGPGTLLQQGASGWQHKGISSGHNTESFSREREASADGISNRFTSMSPYRHDDSPQSTSSHVGTPKLVKPDSSIEQPSSFSASGSDQKDSPSSCLPVKECSPVTSSIMTNESTRGRTSRPPVQSTNRSASGANGGRRLGFPGDHNTEPFRVATPKPVKLNSSIEEPFCSSASGSKQKDSPSSCHSVKDCSPVIHAVDSGFGKKHSKEIKPSEQSSQEQASNVVKSENLDQQCFGFDIFREKAGFTPKIRRSLLEINREKRKEIERSMNAQNIQILCDGMVLLKSFIPLLDQIKLVNTCRKLGIGPGGFYKPGYRDGAKLHLQMMCLGKNWDPETSQYGDKRPCDGATPPLIPDEFHHLVQNALHKSQSYLENQSKRKNIDDVLPSMSPNICIVNFYTTSGKLGLHQDKDESRESINRGLPVVSFSIGDAAEFLYGSERDIEKAKNVLLESGDVLIFGGKSRLIYHGVSSIKPQTASEYLSHETNLKPGRLNLTFRQY